jgi:hypothetical protein
MQIWDPDVLEALVISIAATLQGLSENSSNTIMAYEPSLYDTSCTKTDCGDTSYWTSVGGVVLAMYTEQTTDTGGAIQEQDLEIRLTLEEGDGPEYECSVGAFIFDAMAALGVVPGFEWFEAAADIVTVGALGMSMTCLIEDETGDGDGSGDDSTSTVVTATSASNTYTLLPNPDYPCTTTLANTAIVEYASSVITGGATICTGSSSTVQAGKSILIQAAQDATVPVGTLTGEDLFTSVSSALAAGCTVATEGVTVTSCSDLPKITGIQYYTTYEDDDGNMEITYSGITGAPEGDTDGKIELDVLLMSVWNQDVLNALINSIAATLQGMSVNTTNDITVLANDLGEGNGSSSNYTTVSGIVLAYYTEQTAATGGDVARQDLEVQFTLEQDGGEYDCGAGAFVFDALAVISLLPGFEWMEIPAAGAAFGMSMVCMLSDELGSD